LDPPEIEATLKLKPRDAKAMLARRLVKRLHGEQAAARAERDFDIKFRKREAPEIVEEYTIFGPTNIVDLLVRTGIATTRNEARRLAIQGGVRINGEKVDENAQGTAGDLISARRRYIRLRVN
jgi:tyrosyl-tRNA synthetase